MTDLPWQESPGGLADSLEENLTPEERLEAIVEILAHGGLALMAGKTGPRQGAVIVDFPGHKSGHGSQGGTHET